MVYVSLLEVRICSAKDAEWEGIVSRKGSYRILDTKSSSLLLLFIQCVWRGTYEKVGSLSGSSNGDHYSKKEES